MTGASDEDKTRHIGEEAEEDAERRYKPYYVNSWAAVIGINNYAHLAKRLSYAVADAEGMANLLITQLDFPRENVFVVLDSPSPRLSTAYKLYSGDASKATIEQLLLTDLPSMAGDDDRVLIFFAGHGQRRPLADGATKGYLMPADAQPDQWHEWIDIDGILDSNLYEAKHVFYLLDACYSGLAETRAPEAPSRYERDLLTRRARQVLTAGKDDQVVADAGGEGHSIFTNCVLEGLGDGLAAQEGSQMVTGFDLMRYVTRRVARDTNSLQTPDEGTRLGHRGGDFVFRLPRTFGAALSPQEHLTLGTRLYELGQRLDERGRYASARRQFEEVLRCPNLDEELAEHARLWIARTFVAEGDLDRALEELEALTRPADGAPCPEALIALAITYARRAEPPRAIETLKRFVYLHPQHRDVSWVRDFIAASETDTAGRRLALLVGNDEYVSGSFPSLAGCANDVKLITRTLTKVFGFRESDITILTGRAATRQRILSELASLAETTEPGDAVVFFRSGYTDYLTKDDQQVSALVPYDGVTDEGYLDENKVITLGELDERLRQIPACRKWVVWDGSGGELVAQVRHHRQYDLYVAASPGEIVYEVLGEIGPAGAFVYALTDALGKWDAGVMTHRELYRRTVTELEEIGLAQEQTPRFIAAQDEMAMPGLDTAFVAAWELAYEGRVQSDARLDSIERFIHSGQSLYVPAERALGREFLERGRFIDAAEAFERVIQSASIPDAGDHLNLARAQLRCRQFAKAVETLHAALSVETNHQRRDMLRDLEGMVNRLEENPPKFALLVGVEYLREGKWQPHPGVEDDIELMKQALVEHASFHPANVTVLLNDAATKEATLANLESMAERGAGASNLFYFAGNGRCGRPGSAVIHCPTEASTILADLSLGELAARVRRLPNLVSIIDAAWYAQAGLVPETRRAGGEATPIRAESGMERAIGTVSILTKGLNPNRKKGTRSGLTRELVRVLAASTETPLTYRGWVDAASMGLEEPKPTVYGPHADHPIFTDGALFEDALQLTDRMDHVRFEEAISLLRALIRRRRLRKGDEYPEGRLDLALLYAATGEHGRALDQLTRYAEPAWLELDPEMEPERDEWLRLTRYHTGRLLYETRRDLGTAVDKLRDAAAAAVDDIRVQFYLGQSLRALAEEVQRESNREATEALREYLLAGAPLGHEDEVRAFLESRTQGKER